MQVPGLQRLVRPVGGEGTTYVLLEELVRSELQALFPGQQVIESAVFRVSRDAALDLDDEGGGDYLEAIQEELLKLRRSQLASQSRRVARTSSANGKRLQMSNRESRDARPLDLRGSCRS